MADSELTGSDFTQSDEPLKLFGAYQATPEWRFGANAILQSGRPLNCLGYYAGNLDEVSIAYRSASFWSAWASESR